jgi:hypothetical protein
MTSVHLMTLLFRADAAAAKGGPAELEKALARLQEAAALDLTENQAMIVEKRAEAIRSILEAAAAGAAAAGEAAEQAPPVQEEGPPPEVEEGATAQPEEATPGEAPPAEGAEVGKTEITI